MNISIKVSARSSRNDIKLLSDGSYKVFLKAPPVDGKANDALVSLLSKHFGVSKSKIKIARGLTSRSKLIIID